MEFFNAYRIASPKMKNLPCEFYLHNYAVTKDHEWNPILYVGDVQLREFMSWVQNEISWGQQHGVYRQLEFDIPLHVRDESNNLRDIYREWHRMLLRLSYGKKIMPWIEAAYTEYEVKTTTKEETMRRCLSQRWNSLTNELKHAEPHSIHNYVAVLKRIERHIHIGRTQG